MYIKFRGAQTYFTNAYILRSKGVNSTRTDMEYYSRSKHAAYTLLSKRALLEEFVVGHVP